MGVTFRTGGYIKHVFLGGRTIKDGEAAAVWNINGVHRQIIGPKRIIMYNSTIRFLTCYTAKQDQYIHVDHKNGQVELIYGPASLYENPVCHEKITIHDGIRLDSSSECIIVYKSKKIETIGLVEPEDLKKSSTNPIPLWSPKCERQKREVRGPMLFLPADDETVHQFTWSGIDERTSSMIPRKDTFSVLRTNPNRTLKLTLPIVTSDNVLFNASIFLHYKIIRLSEVVSSKDPMDNMYDGLKADVHILGQQISSEYLHKMVDGSNEVTKRLSTLTTYPTLCSTAEKCGFQIESVGVKNLSYSSVLEKQVELDQKRSANLRAEISEKRQQREINEIQLEDRRKFIQQQEELKWLQLESNARIEKESFAMKEAELERKLMLLKKEQDAMHCEEGSKDKVVIDFLKALKKEGVDMNSFMCTVGGLGMVSPILSKGASFKTTRVFQTEGKIKQDLQETY